MQPHPASPSQQGPDPLAAIEDSPPGGVQADYRLGELLGKGSFGDVFAATDRRTGAHVAVKVMLRAKVKASSIFREYNVLTHVARGGGHPAVVGYQRAYKTPTDVSFVFERMRGGELFDRLVRHGAYPEAVVSAAFRPVAEGLAFLHSRGVVHRDLKPENILLLLAHGPPHASHAALTLKIADFGLSQLIGPNERLQKVCGTWAYAAPEMSDPARPGYDAKFDTFSFGVVLFVALAGFHPFDPSGTLPVADIKARARAATFDFAGEEWARVSDVGKDLIRRLIVRDPESRLDSAAVLRHPWFRGAAGAPVPRGLSGLLGERSSGADGSGPPSSVSVVGGGTVPPPPLPAAAAAAALAKSLTRAGERSEEGEEEEDGRAARGEEETAAAAPTAGGRARARREGPPTRAPPSHLVRLLLHPPPPRLPPSVIHRLQHAEELQHMRRDASRGPPRLRADGPHAAPSWGGGPRSTLRPAATQSEGGGAETAGEDGPPLQHQHGMSGSATSPALVFLDGGGGGGGRGPRRRQSPGEFAGEGEGDGGDGDDDSGGWGGEGGSSRRGAWARITQSAPSPPRASSLALAATKAAGEGSAGGPRAPLSPLPLHLHTPEHEHPHVLTRYPTFSAPTSDGKSSVRAGSPCAAWGLTPRAGTAPLPGGRGEGWLAEGGGGGGGGGGSEGPRAEGGEDAAAAVAGAPPLDVVERPS